MVNVFFLPPSKKIDPLCKDALLQHTKRACYQAGFLWKKGIYKNNDNNNNTRTKALQMVVDNFMARTKWL